MLHFHEALIWLHTGHTHFGSICFLLQYKRKPRCLIRLIEKLVDVAKHTCPCVSLTEQECHWHLLRFNLNSGSHKNTLRGKGEAAEGQAVFAKN